jgi:hypothetical protein
VEVDSVAKEVPYALKVSEEVRARLKAFCESRGILQAHFVEQALIERLDREEMLEDALEIKRWKHEEPHKIDFEIYLKERGKAKRAKAS